MSALDTRAGECVHGVSWYVRTCADCDNDFRAMLAHRGDPAPVFTDHPDRCRCNGCA